MDSDTIRFKSKFSIISIVFFLLGFLFCLLLGFYFWPENLDESIPILILSSFFLLISVGCLIALFSLKTIVIKREALLLKYPLLRIEKHIEWKYITEIIRKGAFLPGGEGQILDLGSEIIIKNNKKSYEFTSFCYRNFPTFLIELDKRIDPRLKKKMKDNFKKEKQRKYQIEKTLRKQNKYELIFALILILIILIFRITAKI